MSIIIQKISTQQNKSTLKWISAGLTVFGFVYLGKVIYNKLKSNKQPTKKEQIPKKISPKSDNKNTERLNTKVTQYSEYYFDKDQQIQNIESTISQNPTVQQIYLNSPLIARDQFIKYTRQIRKRRRLIRKTNQDQYINLILTYENEIKQLLYRSRMQLLESLNIEQQVFEDMQQNYEALEDLRAINRKSQQILRSKLITDTKYRKISNQKLNQIIQQQLCFMRNRMYSRLKDKLQKETIIDESQTLLVVEALQQDIIYEKFGYEVEDIKRKIEEIGYNTKQIDAARGDMEVDIGGFKFDSLESLQDYQQVYQMKQNIKKTANSLLQSGEDVDQK